MVRQRRMATRIAWSAALVLSAAAVTAWMIPCVLGKECRGGSIPGLVLGTLGFAGIVYSAAYSIRKIWVRHSIFALEEWLYGHVVIGTLALFVIIAHSGFRLQNQPAAIALAFLTLTVISGVVGLFLVHLLPQSLARKTATILVPDELCSRISHLHDEISELCTNNGGVFLEIYNELIIPLYKTRVGDDPPSADMHPWESKINPNNSETMMQLASKAEEVHDLLLLLGRHMKFQWWIRGWLLLHVPATLGLLVFSLLHVITILYYGDA